MCVGIAVSIQMHKCLTRALCVFELESPTYTEGWVAGWGVSVPACVPGVCVCALAGWVAGCRVTRHGYGGICALRNTESFFLCGNKAPNLQPAANLAKTKCKINIETDKNKRRRQQRFLSLQLCIPFVDIFLCLLGCQRFSVTG